MSILAKCQPFARHGLGETQAKLQASGPPAMGWVTTRDHIHIVWIWSNNPSTYVGYVLSINQSISASWPHMGLCHILVKFTVVVRGN
jgi:hypothetical protein